MSCTYLHNCIDMYFVSGKMTHVHPDQSGQNPFLANIHIMVMICTTSLVHPNQSGQNPCLAHIPITVMICTMRLVK